MEKELVDQVRINPDDNGPKQLFFRPVYLLLWSDGSVTWEAEED